MGLADDDLHALDARYPFARTLSQPLRARLRTEAQRLDVPAAARLFDAGEPCRGFPLVLRGGVRVAKVAPSGREIELYRVAPGDGCILTSGCLLTGRDYAARGTTHAPTTLVVLPRPLFESLLDEHPAFRSEVLAMFAQRFSELMAAIEAVAFQRVDARLAAALLRHGPDVRTTHQALADEIGSVREIVSRVLAEFAARDWVRGGRGRVELLDLPALRALVRQDAGAATAPGD